MGLTCNTHRPPTALSLCQLVCVPPGFFHSKTNLRMLYSMCIVLSFAVRAFLLGNSGGKQEEGWFVSNPNSKNRQRF